MELRETGAFSIMDLRNEEAEHSIEMQLPYIAKIMEKYIFIRLKKYIQSKIKLRLNLDENIETKSFIFSRILWIKLWVRNFHIFF